MMNDFLKYGATLMLSLVLTSCNIVTPLCVTPCGTRFMGVLETGEMPAGWSCEDINRAERVLQSVALPSMPDVCKAVKDVEIYHSPDNPFRYGKRTLEGIAFCDRRLVILSNLPPEVSAYAHEMFHIMQHCEAELPADPGHDDDHADWARTHIDAAISRWHMIMMD